MSSNYYVYTHSDPITGLVRYVGKGHGNRAYRLSRKRSLHHFNWLNQLTNQGLKPVVDLIEENLTEQQAFDLEKLWIAAFKHEGLPLTNLTEGGEGPSGQVPWNKGLKGVQVSSRRGKKLAPLKEEHRLKISAALKGKPLSEEHRQNISTSRKRTG